MSPCECYDKEYVNGVPKERHVLTGTTRERIRCTDCRAKDALLEQAIFRLRVMCQEWREAVGTPEENSTPGDTLEKSEAVLTRAAELGVKGEGEHGS